MADSLGTYRAKLSGNPEGRETQKNLLVYVGAPMDGVRLHITSDSGFSLASVALTRDQIATLVAWLKETTE